MEDFFQPQVIITLLGYLICAATMWGAIRMDIANIHREIAEHKAASGKEFDKVDSRVTEAHQRIDRLVERRNFVRKDT